MHDIIDLLRAFFQCFILILRRGIGTLNFSKIELSTRNKRKQQTDIDIGTLFDSHVLTIDLVDDVIYKFAFDGSLARNNSKQNERTYIGNASENISSPEILSLYNNIF
jgi:hypothetical protein